MPDIVTDPNEILLYGRRYPLWGTVRKTNVSPFPPKFVQGDYTRDSNMLESTWVITNMAGGLGVLHAKMPDHIDRFWDTTLSTMYRYLSLPGEVVEASEAGGFDMLMEFNGQLYGLTSGLFHVWDGSDMVPVIVTDLLGQNPHTVSVATAPVAWAVFNGTLHILCTNGMYTWTGTTWTAHVSDPDGPEGPTWEPDTVAAVVWDDKLFRLDSNNFLSYFPIPDPRTLVDGLGFPIPPDYADESLWVECGRLQLPQNFCRQLLVYYDLTGSPVIHAITKIGVYAFDFYSQKFFATALTYPYTDSAGKGAVVWRGDLYVPAGPDAYKTNGQIIESIAPSKDEGLPASLQGDVVRFVAGHGYLYAIISSVLDTSGGVAPQTIPFLTDDTPDSGSAVVHDPLGHFIEQDPLMETRAQGAVLYTSGSSWHVMTKVDAGSGMGDSLVLTVDGEYRMWFSTANGLYYRVFQPGLHNPLLNPLQRFGKQGYLETPWTDMSWAEMDKLALELDLETSGCSDDERITFYVAWDENETWEKIGTVTSNGKTVFDIGPAQGVRFRSVRIRIEMERGDNPRLTPILRSAVLSFLRRPEKTNGYEFQLDLSKDYLGRTPEDLIMELNEIYEDVYAGTFAYNDRILGNRNLRVVVSNFGAAELPGSESMGRYTVSVLDLKRRRTRG